MSLSHFLSAFHTTKPSYFVHALDSLDETIHTIDRTSLIIIVGPKKSNQRSPFREIPTRDKKKKKREKKRERTIITYTRESKNIFLSVVYTCPPSLSLRRDDTNTQVSAEKKERFIFFTHKCVWRACCKTGDLRIRIGRKRKKCS